MQKLSYLLLITLLLSACNTKQPNNIEAESEKNDQNISKEKKLVEKIFYNIPSPLEMAKIARDAGMEFNNELMNPIEHNQSYIDQTKQALNLGVYGADLSYSRIFDQVQKSVNYLSAIRELTEALQIPQDHGNFAIDKLEKHIDNRDSLLHIITEIYGDVDNYLKENNRSLVAVMIITGGWVEGNYLAINSMDFNNPNKEVIKRIGEQKLALESLVKLVEPHVRKEHKSADILNELKELRKLYNKVKVTTIHEGVETDGKNNKTTIKGTTKVEIETNTLKHIKERISKIRNQITTP